MASNFQCPAWNPRASYRGVFRHDDLESNVAIKEANQNAPKVALIVGVTGIVGKALLELLSKPTTPGYPWKVYGVARRPQPTWLKSPAAEGGNDTAESTEVRGGFQYIQCDLSDRVDTLHKLSNLRDVTHLFWLTWAAGANEEEHVELNAKMYQNALDAIQQEEGGFLEHIVMQTGGKYYLSAAGIPDMPFKASADIPFKEHEPRSPNPNFYYTLVDMTLEAVEKSRGKVTWSEHRPGVIFGFAPRNLMNLVGTIATYALICKEDNVPFVFPGSSYAWTCLFDASDAGLIAEQELWAALTPAARNQSYNTTNGDFFTFKTIWHRVAERFGLQVPEFHETNVHLAELMKDKAATWESIVAKNKLEPTSIADVGHWWFADWFFYAPFEAVMSMNKSRKLGFTGWRDSEESLLATLDEMKRLNIIP